MSIKSNKISLLVDPNNGCNLNCLHCGLACPHLVHFSKQSIMEEKDFVRMIEILSPYISGLSIGCIREPLVHPQIKDLMLICDELDNLEGLSLTTNGILLNKEITDLIMTTKHSWSINLSIESANDNVYKKIRRGAKLETLKKNLECIKELSEKFGKSVKISLSSVVMNLNYKTFGDLLDFAVSFGASSIKPLKLNIHDYNQQLALMKEEENEFLEILKDMKKNAEKSNIVLNASEFGLATENYNNKIDENTQSSKSKVAVMNHLGDIYPPGYRGSIGCIFKPEDLPKIFDFYNINN